VAVDETYCWVANIFDDNVTRIKKSDLTTTLIKVGDSPRNMAVDETDCWVLNFCSNNVTRIKKSDLTTTNITVGTKPDGVAVDETYCWVANGDDNNVTRIKKSDSTTTLIEAGTHPNGVAVDETYWWVTNHDDNNVTRIRKSDSTTTTIKVIKVGTNPCGVAVDETYCWVTNQNSNNVTRIKKSDLTTTNIPVGIVPFSLGDMTGYAYDFFFRVDVPRVIKSGVITLDSGADLNKIVSGCLQDLPDPAKRPKAETILVGLKEKALEPLIAGFKDEIKSQEEFSQKVVAEIKVLIPQLGVEEWPEREKAQKQLEAIGRKAIPLLKEAKDKDKNPEIRMRTRLALDKISEQGYTESELQHRGFIASVLNIMGNIGSPKRPVLECFLVTLSDSDRFLRRLAYMWLKKLTGKDLPFDPLKTPPEEAAHIHAWEDMIKK
jgi:hypothetical protein